MSGPITITVEPGADVDAPPSREVLAGLMAFNQSKAPLDARFSVLARDGETDALLAGLGLGLRGDSAFTWWGTWSEPEAPAGTEAAILTAAERWMRAIGIRNATITARARADRSALEAVGFRLVQDVVDHMRGGGLGIFRKALEGALPAAPAPAGVTLTIATPPSKPLGEESWRRANLWRQRLMPEPHRWVSAFVRQDGAVKGGAICYAVADEFMVDMVWLDDSLRGTGMGARMLNAALDAGRAMGCRRATVETADFQAPGFYRKVGFQDLAYLADLTPGDGMTVLRMPL